MKAWYERLQERERLLIIGTALLLVPLFLYLLVWEPLSKSVSSLQASVTAAEGQVHWMQSANQEVRELRKSGNSSATFPGDSMIKSVENSANAGGIRSAIQRMEPQGSDKISLELRDITFDQLIPWLGHLEKQFGISAAQFNATPSQGKGRVDARISLERRS